MSVLHTYAKKWVTSSPSFYVTLVDSRLEYSKRSAQAAAQALYSQLGLANFEDFKGLLSFLAETSIFRDIHALKTLKNLDFSSIATQSMNNYYIEPVWNIEYVSGTDKEIIIDVQTEEVRVSGKMPSVQLDRDSVRAILHEHFGTRKNLAVDKIIPTLAEKIRNESIIISEKSQSAIDTFSFTETRRFPYDYTREEIRELKRLGLNFDDAELSDILGKEVVSIIKSYLPKTSPNIEDIIRENFYDKFKNRRASRGELTRSAIDNLALRVGKGILENYYRTIENKIPPRYQQGAKFLIESLIARNISSVPNSIEDLIRLLNIPVDIFLPYTSSKASGLTKQKHTLEQYSDKMGGLDIHRAELFTFLANYYFNKDYSNQVSTSVEDAEKYYETLTEQLANRSVSLGIGSAPFSLIDGNTLIQTSEIIGVLQEHLVTLKINIKGQSSGYQDTDFLSDLDRYYWRRIGKIADSAASWEFIGTEYFDEFTRSKITVTSSFSYRNFVKDIRGLGMKL